ncbi:MAG: GAF domain-containing protein [Magnetococcales bacterium]|nr:GAF domain-containing protein [Magnetococcales bacterium]
MSTQPSASLLDRENALHRPILWPLFGTFVALLLLFLFAAYLFDTTLADYLQQQGTRDLVQKLELTRYHQRITQQALLIIAITALSVIVLGVLLHHLLRRTEREIQQTAIDQQQSESGLLNSRALLHNTLEALGDGILVIGADHTFRHANAQFFSLWQIDDSNRHSMQTIAEAIRRQLLAAEPFLQLLQHPPTAQTHQGVLQCHTGQVLEYHSFPVPCAEVRCDQVWVFHDKTRRAAMEQREERALQSRIAISALLETGMASLSLEAQLHAALEIILAVPWLSLEYKGSIFLMEEGGEHLVMAAQRGLSEQLLSRCAQVPMGYCLCGRAAQQQETLFAAHVDEQHQVRLPDMQPHGHYCVPILLCDRLVGVLNLYVPDGYQRNPEEEAFLTTISYTLANLIERRVAEQDLLELRTTLVDTLDHMITEEPHALPGRRRWREKAPRKRKKKTSTRQRQPHRWLAI